jgi:hypothetical protein
VTTAIISIETVLLIVLVVLVAGLLRSHAEILRRLGPGTDPAIAPPPSRSRTTAEDVVAPQLAGTTPDGDVVSLSFESSASAPTLLAFLTSGCSTCAGFWQSLGEPRLPAGIQTVIVAHGAERERPAKLRELAPESVPVVMSSQAWADYRVPGSPYFVLVDGTIRGEGVATTWQAVASLVSDAFEEQQSSWSASGGTGRVQQIDEKLAAAGIGPGHPSLYPGDETERR